MTLSQNSGLDSGFAFPLTAEAVQQNQQEIINNSKLVFLVVKVLPTAFCPSLVFSVLKVTSSEFMKKKCENLKSYFTSIIHPSVLERAQNFNAFSNLIVY